MIFVQSLGRQTEESYLIIKLKQKEFYHGKFLQPDDFKLFYETLSKENNLNVSETRKLNLLLICIYKVAKKNKEALNLYKEKFTGNFIPKVTELETLHLLYNLVEFESKYKVKSKEQLNQLKNELSQRNSQSKTFEDYLLYKYYTATLAYFNEDYAYTISTTTDIIIDISERAQKDNIQRTELINYIQIQNSLLRIKTLEKDKSPSSRRDIISHLDSFFEDTKRPKEDFAIKVGLKMYNLQSIEGDYQGCIKTLEKCLQLLYKETLFGKSHPYLMEQKLLISGLLGYYNSLMGNFHEVKRFSKKINKSLSYLKEFNKTALGKSKFTDIIPKYEFYNTVLQSLIGGPNEVSQDLKNSSIQNYKSVIGNEYSDLDDVVLNFHLLDHKDKEMSGCFFEKVKEYENNYLATNKPLEEKNLLLFYLFLYNKLSLLTKTPPKKPSQINSQIKDIKDLAKKIIDYTVNTIEKTNPYLKTLFQLGFFKELFNRIYFAYISSFYNAKNYDRAIKEFKYYYDFARLQFELTTNQPTYFNILKIEGDCFFKKGEYREAEKAYQQLKEKSKQKGLIEVNLGICYVFLGEKKKAKEILLLAKGEFTNKSEKIKYIDNILKKID